MFKTMPADWRFIIPASIIWILALCITAWDFLVLQKATFQITIFSLFGAVFILKGMTLRLVARKTLGKHFSYMLRVLDNHQLVDYGIYRYIRHPAYTGDLLVQLGITLLFASVFGLMCMLLLVPCFMYRIWIEENMLAEKFGSTFRSYQANSWRLIPYIY